jgi:hypothetical protein
MTQDGSARQPNSRAVARDKIEQTHFRRVERKDPGCFLAEREKPLGAQEAAAEREGSQAEKRAAVGMHLGLSGIPNRQSSLVRPYLRSVSQAYFTEQKGSHRLTRMKHGLGKGNQPECLRG